MNVWDRQPAMVTYATYVDPAANSDKFYEVRVDRQDDGQWRMTKRYGRNPDTKGGQTRPTVHPTEAAARDTARAAMNSKISEGYEPSPWPHGNEAMPDFHDLEATERWLARQ